MLITPPYSKLENFVRDLAGQAYAVLPPVEVAGFQGDDLAALQALQPFCSRLPADRWLKDGGHYRRRRHSCFIVQQGHVEQVPHRAHWQPVEYNALHGGVLRMFDPVEREMVIQPVWQKMLMRLGEVCSAIKGEQRWFVEAHVFRIDTTGGIGRPTPEGAHRDGVDFVSIFLADRQHVQGGESRVFLNNASEGRRFTLLENWTLMMLDDERMIHESTPIQPVNGNGFRDTLVLTWRKNGFLSPDVLRNR